MSKNYNGPERRTACEIDCDYKNLLLNEILPKLDEVHDLAVGMKAVFSAIKYGVYVIGALLAIVGVVYEIVR